MHTARNFYATIVLTIFAAVAFPAYIVYMDASSMFTDRLEKRQQQLVRSLYQSMLTRFSDAIMLTELIAEANKVREFVLLPAARNEEAENVTHILCRTSNRHATDSTLFVLGMDGRVLLAEDGTTDMGGFSGVDPAVMADVERGSLVSAVRMNGQWVPLFLSPIREDNRVAGAVALSWPLNDMGRQWREQAETAHEQMRIVLVDKQGMVVFVSDSEGDSLLKPGMRVGDTPLGHVFLSGKDGSQIFTDINGQERMGVYFSLPEVGWTVIISSPRSVVTGAVHSLLLRSSGIALIFATLAALLVSMLILRMTRSLRQGAWQLSMVMQGAGMGVWDCDVSKGVFSYSRRWARVVGLSPQEEGVRLGQRAEAASGDTSRKTGDSQSAPRSQPLRWLLHRIHPEDREIIVNMGKDGDVGGQNMSYEFRFLQADGSWRWMQSWCRVLDKDGHGQPLHITGVTMDIDLRKQAEKQDAAQRSQLEALVALRTEDLRNTRDQALAATQAKSYFLSTMSHEIRTPMNAIMGFLQLFERDNLNARQLDYLNKIRTASGGLLGVINDILDISKIEAGKLEVERVPFSLRGVMDAVYSIMSFAAKEKKVELSMGIDDAAPDRLMGDPTRLHQILLNLVSNAVKFTKEGRICLGVRVEEQGAEALGHPEKESGAEKVAGPAGVAQPTAGRWLVFSVADTGVGISEEQQQRLFQPYAQADSSVTRKFGGTGLGLAICKQLVELMGGDIGVYSEAGKGTTFTFRLYMEDAPSVEGNPGLVAGHADTTQAEHLQGVRALLVEDNIINQEVARTQLEHMGMVVEVADNGEIALGMVQEKDYAVVLMDMQMPVMDGLEATRRIRALAQGAQSAERPVQESPEQAASPSWPRRDLPIIAMTANAMSEDRRQCLDAGMNAHIAKPFDAEELKILLLQWVGRAAE